MSDEILSADANGRLRTIVERIERVEEDESALKADKKEIYAEAKGDGYDVKALRKLVRIRRQDRRARAEEAAIVETYANAIGEVLP